MALRHCTTTELLCRAYDLSTRKLTDWRFYNRFKPNKEDTYIAIAGPSQDEWLEAFEKKLPELNGKIIFKSEKARNTNYPESGPRNTLIVFEFE